MDQMKPHIPLSIGALHFIGIGGMGMSGLAEILNELGYKVQGSDIKESAVIQRLRKKGIKINIGHKKEHVENAEVIIRSDIIQDNNPEIKAARKRGLPIVRRVEMLTELMKLKKSIAIGGTHGKTTTTMMIATLLETAGKDPTIINGGILNTYGTNAKLGHGKWVVAEACEAYGNLVLFHPTIAVVTNIDPEHMEYYGEMEKLTNAFKTFIENIPFYGFACLCMDHPEIRKMLPTIKDRRYITYGKNKKSEIQAINTYPSENGMIFDVIIKGKEGQQTWKEFKLPMYGNHNVQNALAAIAIGYKLNIAQDTIRKAIENFKGVKRRFTEVEEVNGITIIDDYAHHPVEIQRVLETAKSVAKGKVLTIFQPHKFSRLKNLFSEFSVSFNNAHNVWVANVYSAGEKPIKNVSNKTLVQAIQKQGHKNAKVLKKEEDIADEIVKVAKPGDMIIFMGAGNVTEWAYKLPNQLRGRLK